MCYKFSCQSKHAVINLIFYFQVQKLINGKGLNEIPQWHCLRYFKHDIHLMRRCRNHRVPMLRRPVDKK